MSKYIRLLRRLAKDGCLTADTAEALINANIEDGGPGSGNHGHKGRPGKRGGSAKKGAGGSAPNPKEMKTGESFKWVRTDPKGRQETETIRKTPNGFESEVATWYSGNLGKSEVNENYVNQILSKAKPGEIEFINGFNPHGNMTGSNLIWGKGTEELARAGHGTGARYNHNGKMDLEKKQKELESIQVKMVQQEEAGRKRDYYVAYSDNGGQRVMMPASHYSPEDVKKMFAKVNKLPPQETGKSSEISPPMKEYVDSIVKELRKRIDPEYPFESGLVRDLSNDLHWVNQAESRDEFIERGEQTLEHWRDEHFISQAGIEDPLWDDWFSDQLDEFDKVLQSEKEKRDKESPMEEGGKEPPSEGEPYGTSEKTEHGSLKRDASSSDRMMKDFSEKCKTSEDVEKFLTDMAPGTAFRWKTPGKKKNYDWAIKNADGSLTFISKVDGSQTVYSPGALAADIAEAGKGVPTDAIGEFCVPKKTASGKDAYWTAKRQFAQLEHNPGDDYTGKRVSMDESIQNNIDRNDGKASYPKEKGNASKEYTSVQKDEKGRILSAGKPVGVLSKGSGVTGIDPKDIAKKNPDDMVYNTLSEHCVETQDGRLVLTSEREELHQKIISKLFEKARKPADGKKVATFLGGGSAAGKGTIQGPDSGVDFPSAEDSPVIDADKLKESLPEYTDTAFSDEHESAASYAHEESSSLAKRAMQAAIANGYSFTLDGTGDGNIESMLKKIKQAQDNGYAVNGVYVTCPTEKAVERSVGRSKTDKYGRLVQPETVRNIHKEVSKIFPRVAKKMDHCELYDTDQGGKPVLIAVCDKGGPIHVINRKLYRAFRKKAKE